MELRSTREMRRNERLAKTTAKQVDTASVQSQAKPAQRQTVDKCTLSRQALTCLEQQNRLTQELEERRARQQSRFAKCQNKKSELDMLSIELKVLEACQKIAASIIKGDKVPLKDLKFLMENDPAGYKLAMAMRREKKDPEEVESVLDEMEQSASGEGAQSCGESPAAAPAAEVPAAPAVS